jgi:hypothetical protein
MVHEIKHDGFWLQIHVGGSRARLYTMTGVDWTERHPLECEDVARVQASHVVLDANRCCGIGARLGIRPGHQSISWRSTTVTCPGILTNSP